MSNFAYLIDSADYLKATPPAAGSAMDSLYPVGNLISLPVSLPAKFTGNAATIYIDLGIARSVNLVAVIAHNLSATASMTVFAGTTTACSDYSANLTWRDITMFLYLTAAQTYRYWKIVITDNANLDGYISIGRLMMGSAVSVSHNYGYGWLRQRQHRNSGSVTEFGTEYYERIFKATRLVLPFYGLTAAQMAEVVGLVNSCEGSLNPLFLIPDPAGVDGYFGRFTGDPEERIDFYRETSIEFIEASPGRWIKELQPLCYEAGKDSLTDLSAVHTRATAANYEDSVMKLAAAAIDAARSAHHPTVAVKTLLLEGARTNGLSYPADLSNAAWTKSNCTISANADAGPDSSVTADKIIEASDTNQAHGVVRNTPTLTTNADQSFSCFVKASTRTMCYVATMDKAGDTGRSWFNLATGAWATQAAGHTCRVRAYQNSWYRIEVAWNAGTGGTTPTVGLYTASADNTATHDGDGASGIFAVNFQFEVDVVFASSYYAGARGADLLYLPYTQAPQQSTHYLKFVEGGSVLQQGAGLLHIGNAARVGARLQILASGTHYIGVHGVTGSQVVTLLSGTAPNIGQTVELRLQMWADGAIQLSQSIDGGTEETGSKSSVLTKSGLWSAPTAFINSLGSANQGFTNCIAVKGMRGLQTKATMQAQEN